jgi:DNA-binding SARP family transcriptional activator/TolB-like protein
MIELSVLGLHALRDSDGRELPSLLAQPKRFALLSYLAMGSGGGYTRRDSLAALFWPELDQFAARRALRNTLYHVREALGEDVIVTRGDEAVATDPATLTCDVTRLAAAVAAGRYEEAVECYKGELLAGLHFANAGEAFEEWLAAERRRTTDLVLMAVRELVGREERTGDLLAAARWAQRACLLAPGDESWLRRAMLLLDAGGDTGGALRLYETTARRLASEFAATAAAETVALAAQIRDGSSKPIAAAPGAVSPTAAVSSAVPSSAVPPAAASPERSSILWATALAAALVTALLVRAASASHRRAPSHPPRVLVTVFDNRTGDSALQALGRMAQDWLAQGVLRTHLVDVVDPRAVLQQSRSGAGTPVDPLTVAHRTGSTLVVSGSYYRSGDTLFLEAALTDARTGTIDRVIGPIPSSARTPVAGLEALRSRVMTALATAVDARGAPGLETSSEVPPFDAYEAYVEGWNASWHGDAGRAEARFLDAAHQDTAFVAATIAAAATASNSNQCGLVDSLDRVLVGRGLPHERLDQLSLEIAVARCRGRNEEMLRLALERADLSPRTSSYQLSAAAAALWANRPGRALAILQRVDPETDLGWSSDTTHIDYWNDLTEALHLLGRHTDELAAANRIPLAAPLTRVWLRGRALVALSQPTAALVLLDSALSLPVETQNRIGLAPFTDGRPQYDATPAWIASWTAHELLVHGDSVAARQAAFSALSWSRNRPAFERTTFEERLVTTWSLAVIGALAEADSLARQLLAMDSTNVDVRGELAVLAAERGDTARADSLDRWLAAQPVDRVSWSASIYRADVAACLGHATDAVARLVDARDEGVWPMWIHQDPALLPLRSRRDFIALTAPRD